MADPLVVERGLFASAGEGQIVLDKLCFCRELDRQRSNLPKRRLPHDIPDTLPFAGTTPYGRPSWSGLLQFSLVGIPLKAYPAVRTRDVPSARLLHADCGSRLCYAKHCPVHGPVDSAAIVRGYESGPGTSQRGAT